MTAPRVCSIAAHPRSRGENSWFISCVVTFWGSSPLTRGKLCRGNGPRSSRRLIPAHAGKTILTVAGAIFAQAHPRSRGENDPHRGRSDLRPGSSPLTRGKRTARRVVSRARRAHPRSRGENRSGGHRRRLRGAHPRSRGENFTREGCNLLVPGSSPLTRGKRAAAAAAAGYVGLIPAHAGKTWRPACPPWSPRAHPRSRGENIVQFAEQAVNAGSSPLTRGKQSFQVVIIFPSGLIPAHAGKTCPTIRTASGSWAHPRSRGENPIWLRWARLPRGSSALTRGKHQSAVEQPVQERLIPAHAGKTSDAVEARVLLGAHPRSRGENLPLSCEPPIEVGSSPLTWGKRHDHQPRVRRMGLIPAHVGKTSPPTTRRSPTRAHPRSRGENICSRSQHSRFGGSSPLTWGKQVQDRATPRGQGLIPAHVGKTSPSSAPGTPARAHPRSRGENKTYGGGVSEDKGSSPLTLGKHECLSPQYRVRRLIPAHVGKTSGAS